MKYFDFFQELVGYKFNNVFKQVEMYIINFGEGIVFSLHTFTFCRILDDEHIYFTSNDEFFTKNFRSRTEKGYKNDELGKHSLLNESLKEIKKLLKNSYVQSVNLFPNGDLIITFDNGIRFETLIDRKMLNFEYYRLIKFNPSFKHYPRFHKKGHDVIVKFSEKGVDITSRDFEY